MDAEPALLDRRALLRRCIGTTGVVVTGSWAASAAQSSTGSDPATPGRGMLLGPGRVKGPDETRYYLTLLDLDREDAPPERIDTDFFGHGLALDPTDPARAALFEKRGPGACLLDLRARYVVRPIRSDGHPGNREFYGHGAFSPDGAQLYSTETIVDDNYRGVVVVRDGKTLEEIGEFPTYGESPHDCVLRNGGKTLVVTNGGARVHGGSAPCVTYVDVPTQKLIERVTLENDSIGAGHLALSERGDLAVVSAAREWMSIESLGGASFRPAGGELRSMDRPSDITARMKGESLSVAIHEPSGIVGVTNPYASLVTFWNLRKGVIIRSLDLSYPRGIAVTLDGSCFAIGYGKSSSVVLVSTKNLQPVLGSRRSSLAMSGSHIVTHALSKS